MWLIVTWLLLNMILDLATVFYAVLQLYAVLALTQVAKFAINQRDSHGCIKSKKLLLNLLCVNALIISIYIMPGPIKYKSLHEMTL